MIAFVFGGFWAGYAGLYVWCVLAGCFAWYGVNDLVI